jgi:DNA-binding NarL/FixJ family response regulator
MTKLRILIVDDHQIVLTALCRFVDAEADMETVGGACDGAQAVSQARELAPDLVVMDRELASDMDGIEASRRIRADSPQTRVIILSGELRSADLHKGIEAGIKGFLLKTDAACELPRAIRHVARGQAYLSPNISSLVVSEYGTCTGGPARGAEILTLREREVLKLTAEGCRLKEIAGELNIALKTVETHRSHLMKKLACSNSSELTRYAIREGISTI